MLKTIKISNGTVILKEFCSRKLRKQINKELYENVEMKGIGKETNIEGFKMQAMDNANDIALIGMTDKIEINGKEKEININTFDEMDDNDVNLILNEINKITTKAIPNG